MCTRLLRGCDFAVCKIKCTICPHEGLCGQSRVLCIILPLVTRSGLSFLSFLKFKKSCPHTPFESHKHCFTLETFFRGHPSVRKSENAPLPRGVKQCRMSTAKRRKIEGPTSAEFCEWLQQAGIESPKVVYGHGKFGNCLVAVQDIAPGERFASIPLTAIFTEKVARQSRIGTLLKKSLLARDIIASKDPQLPFGRIVMYLYMIEQKHARSVDSPWGPYMRAIPDNYDTPLTWTSEELKYLKGTNLEMAVPNKLRLLRDQYDNLFPCLSELYPNDFPKSNFTWKEFLWAHCAYSSRTFPEKVALEQGELSCEVWEGEMPLSAEEKRSSIGCMIPWLGFMNHRYRTQISWLTISMPDRNKDSSSALSTRSGTRNTGSRFYLEAGEAIAKGAEVFNNYGAKGNEEFLLGYGFCLQDNPHDEYTVSISTKNLDPQTMTLLESSGLGVDHYLGKDRVPPALLRALRICVLNDQERYFLPSESFPWLSRGQDGGCDGLEFVSHRNELEMLSTLKKLLQARLDRMTLSSLEQDEERDYEAICDPSIPFRQQMAAIYRSGQREVLVSCLRKTCVMTQEAGELAKQSMNRLPLVLLAHSQPCPTQEQKDVYNAWLHTGGGENHLELGAGMLEVVSRRKIPAGKSLVQFPAKLTMKISSALESESFGPLASLVDGLDADSLLLLFCIHERSKGEASLWAPFWAIIGDYQPSFVATWPQEDIDRLTATAIGREAAEFAHEQLEDLKDLYEQLFPALTDAHPVGFSAQIYTWESFKWAAWVVDSFSVPSENSTILLPLAQPPLHSSDATSYVHVDAKTSNVLMTTLVDVEKGEAVRVCYNRPLNTEILVSRGWMLMRDSLSSIPFRIADITNQLAAAGEISLTSSQVQSLQTHFEGQTVDFVRGGPLSSRVVKWLELLAGSGPVQDESGEEGRIKLSQAGRSILSVVLNKFVDESEDAITEPQSSALLVNARDLAQLIRTEETRIISSCRLFYGL